MKQIQGPYSLIYFNGRTMRLYFARDSLGRQTLLIGSHQNVIHITSVASKAFGVGSFAEVPPIGIFCLDLSNSEDDLDIRLHTWQDLSTHEHFTEQLRTAEELLCCKILVAGNLEPFWMTTDGRSIGYSFQATLNEHSNKSPLELLTILSQDKNVASNCDELIELLTRSVRARVEATPPFCKNCIKSTNEVHCSHPKIGILFSGGIDCSILAILANKFIDKSNAIDLLNVSFEKIVRNRTQNQPHETYETPDRLTSRETLNELMKLCPERKWNLIEVNVTRDELKDALERRISDLCYPLNSVLDESLGAALWFAASAKGQLISTDYESPSRVRSILPSFSPDKLLIEGFRFC